MPKSKKGGKKKKANLTDEQKAKQAEQKALAEKEKLVQRHKLTDAFLKLKCDKEYELIKLNESKLLDLWRPRLRQLKKSELLDDYELMRNAFERAYGKKDELISQLEGILEQNDEEYDNAFDMHLHNVDKMMEFYKSRLNEVRDSYAAEKEKLLQLLHDEQSKMEQYHEHSMQYLQGVTEGVARRYREMAADAKAELYVPHEEIRNKAFEETQAVKEVIEKKMREVWGAIQERLGIYELNMAPKRKEYLELRKKDDAVLAVIEDLFRRIKVLKEGIDLIEKRTAMFEKFLKSFLEDLTLKRAEVQEKYYKRRETYKFIEELGQRNIRRLVIITRRVLEDIDRNTEQRETMLKCIDRSRKGERLDEKVDPFMLRWGLGDTLESLENEDSGASLYFPHDHDAMEHMDYGTSVPKARHLFTCDCNPCTCEVAGEEGSIGVEGPVAAFVQEHSMLEKFWVRFNRVNLEKTVLVNRKRAMMEDNYKLRLALRNYMGGLNPFSHNIYAFSDQLAKNAKKNYDRVVKSVLKELKRRERCRKVGGIKMY